MASQTNNFHCFTGVGLMFWNSIARGIPVSHVRSGQHGTSLVHPKDVDGFAVQNGGMNTPQIVKMNPGNYYRFFGTISNNQYGAGSSMAGGWWIEYETYVALTDYAGQRDTSLAKAAQQLLVIPNEWHDCGYVGKARLKVPMKAFVGTGKPATGSVSPASSGREAAGISVQTSPGHLEIKQWFVPGSRELLGQAFDVIWTQQVIKKGITLPTG